MSNQKGFSKIAIIIIVLILIGGAYFVFSKKVENIPAQNTENESSQSSQSIGGDLSMSDWKTYRNEEYGFEIEYPKNWLLKDNKINEFDYKIIEFIEPKNKYDLSIGILKTSARETVPYSRLGNMEDHVSFGTSFGVIWRNKEPFYSDEEDYYYFELVRQKQSKSKDYDSIFSEPINGGNFEYLIFYKLPVDYGEGDIVDSRTIETMDTIVKTFKFKKQ